MHIWGKKKCRILGTVHPPVSPELGRQRQEDHQKFNTSPGYTLKSYVAQKSKAKQNKSNDPALFLLWWLERRLTGAHCQVMGTGVQILAPVCQARHVTCNPSSLGEWRQKEC